MSKCDLHIILDRANGTYVGGEEVTGQLTVRVNKPVKCNGLTIEQCWQTHGRGNHDSGGHFGQTLFTGQWEPGTVHQYPFSFTVPSGPLTYRGHYLNIDHYIRARVDIPWAIDPKAELEYVLLPGGAAGEDQTPQEEHVAGIQGAMKKMGKGSLVAAIICLVIGIIFCFPFGIILIPVGLGLLFFSMRNKLAEKKVGQVSFEVPSTNIHSGQRLPVKLMFTPPKAVSLNAVTVTLEGKEQCVSGSGTNRTTHTHKICDQEIILADERRLPADQPVEFESILIIPQTLAYSFSASDNKIIWNLAVRIDIPMWPDWVHSQPLWLGFGPKAAPDPTGQIDQIPQINVGPAIASEPLDSGFGQSSSLASSSAGSSWAGADIPVEAPSQPLPVLEAPALEAFDPIVPLQSVEPLEASVDPISSEPSASSLEMPDLADNATSGLVPPSPPAESQGLAGLSDVIDRILGSDRFGGERSTVIKELVGDEFKFDLEIERIDRTLASGLEKDYRSGRTIVGTLQGSSKKVAIFFSDSLNDQIESLSPGSQISISGAFNKWDDFYEHPQILGSDLQL
jgi:hypothetical protein